jgi:predicted DNA-binding transcriptional regulator YafY
MRYRGAGQLAATQRDVDPYTLVHSWGWHYCIGYCHLRQAVRSFRLDRISQLAVLDQPFAEAAEFDLQAYLKADPWFQGTVRARLRFGPQAAHIALDHRAYWEEYEEQPDGAVLVGFAAPDLDAAVGIVLRYGFPATIVEPAELRERVRARAGALAAHFAVND